MTVTPVEGFAVPGPTFRRDFDHRPVAVGLAPEVTDLGEQHVGLVEAGAAARQRALFLVGPYHRPVVTGW